MSSNQNSSDFGRLTSAWLDGSATADEITRLREIIATDPACAERFAVLARFEPLPAVVRDTEAVPFDLTTIAPEPAPISRPLMTSAAGSTPNKRRTGSRPTQFRAVAALMALSCGGLLVWQFGGFGKKADTDEARPLLGPRRSLGQVAAAENPPSTDNRPTPRVADGRSLEERLDQFFLRGVDLERVPLSQAIGFLQGQLQELNFLHTESLVRLSITVPAGASKRPVTLHAGSITFLKALRSVAGLAGCDMTIGDGAIALTVTREIYPQVAERRDVLSLLRGGDSGADQHRLADLVADAVSLGVSLDLNQPLNTLSTVPMTRGQWGALQMLTAAREQLSQMDAPNFELYLADSSSGTTGQAIKAETVEEMRRNFQSQGKAPLAVIAPDPAAEALDAGGPLPSLTLQPLGEATQITVNLPPADNATPAFDSVPNTFEGTLLPGQGLTVPLAFYSVFAYNKPANVNLFRGLTFLPLQTRAGNSTLAAMRMADLYLSYTGGSAASSTVGAVKDNGGSPANGNGNAANSQGQVLPISGNP